MAPKLTNIIVLIEGMTCVNCENRIEAVLRKTKGIETVDVDYTKGRALLTYDANLIDQDRIESIIEALDYRVKKPETKDKRIAKTKIVSDQKSKIQAQNLQKTTKATKSQAQKTNVNQAIGVGIVLVALFMVINRLGGFNFFNAFPQAEAGMGYGLLFGIGLLTSVHCLAMCGGINLSQCVRVPQPSAGGESKFANLRPSLLYNTGRVISYTVIGGIVGALGSVISFSGKAKGIVAIIAGIFMVIMGLNMLNIFPWLRKFNPRMPKFIARKIYEKRAAGSNSPLFVGLLNGLMPCGPLQAMQIYALSTGSPVKGALSMLVFSLGTVPLMFGLGALSSLLSKKFTQKMVQVSAMLVVILGVVMLQNGIGVSGIAMPSLTRSLNAANSVQSKNLAAPVIENGVQIITTKLNANSYEAITVQKGIPVKWTIKATEDTITGCNNRLLIPEYNVEKQLVPGDNVIEFTPAKSGIVPYSCWMGMIRSKITVVDGQPATPAAGNPPTASNTASTNNKVPAANQGSPPGNRLTTAAGGSSCCGGGTLAGSSVSRQEDIQTAQIVDGQQQATISVDAYGFSPKILVIQKGLETHLKFDLKQATSCNDQVIIPDLNLQLDLTKDGTVPAFVAQNDFAISCWMGMLNMTVKVVDDLGKVDLNTVQADIANTPQRTTGGCCSIA